MLKAAVEAAAIGDDLDAVLSVDVAENVQAASGGLSSGHRSIPMLAGRGHFRLVEPLGRNGRRLARASGASGSIAPICRMNMPDFPPATVAEVISAH